MSNVSIFFSTSVTVDLTQFLIWFNRLIIGQALRNFSAWLLGIWSVERANNNTVATSRPNLIPQIAHFASKLSVSVHLGANNV